MVVVPFGGGTSVVGGLAGVDPDDRPSIAVDLTPDGVGPGARRPVVPGDRGPGHARAGARAGAGGAGPHLRPPAAELGVRHPRRLRGHPLGRAELHRRRPLRRPGRRRSPSRRRPASWSWATRPATAAGPDLLGLALGSEGTLGDHHRADAAGPPQARDLRATRAGRSAPGPAGPGGAAAAGAARPAARHRPALRRRRDPGQPAHGRRRRRARPARQPQGPRATATAACSSSAGRACRRWSGPAGRPPPPLLADGGAIRLGRKVGESWKSHRFAAPYLRDKLLDGGLLVETLETAATWAALPTVYDAVRRALRESLTRDGRRPLIMSHVSHGYPTGASLYVTVLADRDDALPIQQWLRPSGPPPTRCWAPAARSPTTTPSAPTTAPGWSARSARSASRCCARSRSGWTRRASATPASCSRLRDAVDRGGGLQITPDAQIAWPKEKTPAGSTVRLTSRSRSQAAGG